MARLVACGFLIDGLCQTSQSGKVPSFVTGARTVVMILKTVLVFWVNAIVKREIQPWSKLPLL